MFGLLIALIYLIFISLGLPDSLLGSAWPSMNNIYQVNSSLVGLVSLLITLMTIISALLSNKLSKILKIQWIIIISIILTIIGMIGFSFSTYFWMLLIFSIPYGLGAGSIDAALNNYVANNYSAKVMNFLHCFYGVGAVISPNIMALAIKFAKWNEGFRWTSFVQIGILILVIIGIPLWRINENKNNNVEIINNSKIKDVIKLPGVILICLAFFSYCSGEAICFLWSSSFFAKTKDNIPPELIASFGSLIYLGLMSGRILSGLLSSKLDDKKLLRIGIGIELIGIILIGIPINSYIPAVIGFIITGIGMGPIYPSIQHLAPINYGKENSSAVIGLQTAFAYVGSGLMPLLFGIVQEYISMWLLPVFLLFFLILNITLFEISIYRVNKKIIS